MPTSARLDRLVLTNFRNHARLELETTKSAVVLYGANGAGKTNILEAISMLNSGRGLRGADMGAMCYGAPNDTAGPWAVSASIRAQDGVHRLGVGLMAAPGQEDDDAWRRVVRLDGKSISARGMDDVVQIISMTPQHDRLFQLSGTEKRRFLDHLVAAAMPEHRVQVAAFERAMRERNKLLAEDLPDQKWLSSIEREMAAHAIALTSTRIDVLARLQAEIDSADDGAFPSAQLALMGPIEDMLQESLGAEAAESQYGSVLMQQRRLDAGAGRALIGPHRSVFSAIHRGNGQDAALCSTGEQKALIIAIVLAQSRRVAGGLGLGGLYGATAPILLLDEAGAHLDKKRRAALCEALLALPAQAWVTGTDADLFEAFQARADCFAIGPSSAKLA